MFRYIFRQAIRPSEGVLCSWVPVRRVNGASFRVPPTDTTGMVPLLDETQLFVPVVHRRHEVPLRKINGPYKKLRCRHYVYDEIVVPPQPMPEVEIILVKDVPGKGVAGTKLSVPGDKAYAEFLISQFAVYATPANELKYKGLIEAVAKNAVFSTLTAQHTSLLLQERMIFIPMNMHNPWTLEKWHVRVAFRQEGFTLTDECIELPLKPITGPDADKENKHFIITVIINGKERVPVICRINHYTNDEDEKLPIPIAFTSPCEPVFEEDRALIDEHVHRRNQILRFKF